MLNPEVVFQRTQSGRDEIQKKSHGLTQSERLVLIMVDGISSYREVRAKLPVLTDERFHRALSNLQKKELVLEVLMPVPGETAETIERTVIDRFLEQDPLDPVTVILYDPEDELGLLGGQESPKRNDSVIDRVATQTHIPPAQAPVTQVPHQALGPNAAMDAHHAELADTLSQEVKALQAARPQKYEGVERRKTDRRTGDRRAVPHTYAKPQTAKSLHWGYVLIAIGLAFIVGFFVAKMVA